MNKCWVVVLAIALVGCAHSPVSGISDEKGGYVCPSNKTADKVLAPEIGDHCHDGHRKGVIVFVHGLTGGPLSTWKNSNGAYWPELIRSDEAIFSQFNVFTFGYTSHPFSPSPSILEVAELLQKDLLKESVLSAHEQVIFVTHSLGGLVARAFLLRNPTLSEQKVRYIHFFGTPGSGSELANIAWYFSINRQFKQLRELKAWDFLDSELGLWRVRRNGEPAALCACETESVAPLIPLIVEQGSCALMCERPVRSIHGDHIDIVKPSDRNSEAYSEFRAGFAEYLTRPKSVDQIHALTQSIATLTEIVRLSHPEPKGEVTRPKSDQQLKTMATESLYELPKDLTLDFRKPIHLQLNLFEGDQLEILDSASDLERVQYMSAKGKMEPLKKTAPKGLVGPKYVAEGIGASKVAPQFIFTDKSLETHDREMRVRLHYRRDTPGQRLLPLAQIPLAEQDTTVKVKSESGDAKSQPLGTSSSEPKARDICDEIFARSQNLLCHRARDESFVISPAQVFPTGSWESQDLLRTIKIVGSIAKTMKLKYSATVAGYASAQPMSCDRLKRKTGWAKLDHASVASHAIIDGVNPGVELHPDSCRPGQSTDSYGANYLLSYARAVVVANALELSAGESIVVDGIRPSADSYALRGNRSTDRRVVIELRPCKD